jgi:NADH-quinone oxidoreductase subunit C
VKDIIQKYLVDKYEIESESDILTLRVEKDCLLSIMSSLKTNEELLFNQLTDICGIDYSLYGKPEWNTKEATSSGYSRGIKASSHGRIKFGETVDNINIKDRFCVCYHLLSIKHNRRIRVKVYINEDPQILPSITSLWSSADWYEREAFDLFGILFENHPDLRRILTDYGFIGHPFRKDFPLVGNTQIRYDPNLKKIIQEPVDIEPRVLVPKVIREKK